MSKYHLYLFRFSNSERIHKLTEALTHSYEMHNFMNPQKDEAGSRGYTFSIRDISDRTDREKLLLLTSIIASEENREYKPGSDCMLLVRTVRIASDDYLAIISMVDNEVMSSVKDHILGYFFERHEMYNIEKLGEYEPPHLMKTISYWKDLYAKKPETIPVIGDNYVYEQEEFEVEARVAETLLAVCKREKLSVKSFVLAAAGIAVCSKFNVNSTIIGEVRNNDMLKKAPIRVNMYENRAYTVNEIQTQLENLNEYGGCSTSQVESSSGVRFANTMYMGVDFGDLTGLMDSIATIGTGKIYELHCVTDFEIPIVISYHSSGNSIRLLYSYTNRLTMEDNIENINDKVMSALLELTYVFSEDHIDNVFSSIANISSETRIIASKVIFLKNSGIFPDYTNEELIRLAGKCSLRSALPEENIGEQGEVSDGLCIVCDGFVEVNRMGPDNVLRPLQLLSDGDVFAIETVVGDRRLKATYISSGNYARFLTLSTDAIESEIRMHPGILTKLLEIQTERLANFQDIWLTV